MLGAHDQPLGMLWLCVLLVRHVVTIRFQPGGYRQKAVGRGFYGFVACSYRAGVTTAAKVAPASSRTTGVDLTWVLHIEQFLQIGGCLFWEPYTESTAIWGLYQGT